MELWSCRDIEFLDILLTLHISVPTTYLFV